MSLQVHVAYPSFGVVDQNYMPIIHSYNSLSKIVIDLGKLLDESADRVRFVWPSNVSRLTLYAILGLSLGKLRFVCEYLIRAKQKKETPVLDVFHIQSLHDAVTEIASAQNYTETVIDPYDVKSLEAIYHQLRKFLDNLNHDDPQESAAVEENVDAPQSEKSTADETSIKPDANNLGDNLSEIALNAAHYEGYTNLVRAVLLAEAAKMCHNAHIVTKMHLITGPMTLETTETAMTVDALTETCDELRQHLLTVRDLAPDVPQSGLLTSRNLVHKLKDLIDRCESLFHIDLDDNLALVTLKECLLELNTAIAFCSLLVDTVLQSIVYCPELGKLDLEKPEGLKRIFEMVAKHNVRHISNLTAFLHQTFEWVNKRLETKPPVDEHTKKRRVDLVKSLGECITLIKKREEDFASAAENCEPGTNFAWFLSEIAHSLGKYKRKLSVYYTVVGDGKELIKKLIDSASSIQCELDRMSGVLIKINMDVFKTRKTKLPIPEAIENLPPAAFDEAQKKVHDETNKVHGAMGNETCRDLLRALSPGSLDQAIMALRLTIPGINYALHSRVFRPEDTMDLQALATTTETCARLIPYYAKPGQDVFEVAKSRHNFPGMVKHLRELADKYSDTDYAEQSVELLRMAADLIERHWVDTKEKEAKA